MNEVKDGSSEKHDPDHSNVRFSTPIITKEGRPTPEASQETPEVPGKKIRVSDININRYSEEFIELSELASGTYGRVAAARHRLDGVVYAVKVSVFLSIWYRISIMTPLYLIQMSKSQIFGQTHEERIIMNEVFAHSALMKHKHIVRYYNSWVENGRVYIQNEYCEGGSLTGRISHLKLIGKRFSEAEIKKMMLHVCKGLQ